MVAHCELLTHFPISVKVKSRAEEVFQVPQYPRPKCYFAFRTLHTNQFGQTHEPCGNSIGQPNFHNLETGRPLLNTLRLMKAIHVNLNWSVHMTHSLHIINSMVKYLGQNRIDLYNTGELEQRLFANLNVCFSIRPSCKACNFCTKSD